jgi:hypothetical protein
MMAAGGDLGAALGPQAVGLITDLATKNEALLSLAERLSLSPEALGMKMGLLLGFLVSATCAVVMYIFYKNKKNAKICQ